MYHYTPRKDILRRLRQIRRSSYKPNAEYNFINEYTVGYEQHTAFWRYYDGFNLYSTKKLHQIPCGGILFPRELFEEEVD